MNKRVPQKQPKNMLSSVNNNLQYVFNKIQTINMNRFVQVRQQAPIHPSLMQINPRQHNQLKKPVTPAEPKRIEAPIKAKKEEKKGSGLSTDRKSKVLEFLEFNL
jgi:hypothetical protein